MLADPFWLGVEADQCPSGPYTTHVNPVRTRDQKSKNNHPQGNSGRGKSDSGRAGFVPVSFAPVYRRFPLSFRCGAGWLMLSGYILEEDVSWLCGGPRTGFDRPRRIWAMRVGALTWRIMNGPASQPNSQ